MFELNLASLPNYVLYLEGVQLSYIKVFVHIFNLWYSNKPCYITNAEFAKRTELHRDTVINAIQFFEKHNILKRVQKGTKRYLVQAPRAIETESQPVDNSPNNSTNSDQESELDHGGVGVRPFKGSELDHHNNKYNNKYKKSFCNNEDQKANNEKKPAWAEKPKSPFSDPTKQSTSYKPPTQDTKPSEESVTQAMMSLPRHLRPARYRSAVG